jgi:hypothetical protein
MIAKDLAIAHDPIVVDLIVTPGGSAIPLAPLGDGSYLLPAGTTSFSVTPALSGGRAIPDRGEPATYTYAWKLIPLLGGQYAGFTREASTPDGTRVFDTTTSSVVVSVVEPEDSFQVLLTLTTAYETWVSSITVVVAP